MQHFMSLHAYFNTEEHKHIKTTKFLRHYIIIIIIIIIIISLSLMLMIENLHKMLMSLLKR